MAEDGEPKHVKKYRIRKPDGKEQSEIKMMKYYSDPEKQKKLQERIDTYIKGVSDLQKKIKDLQKYVQPDILRNERTEKLE